MRGRNLLATIIPMPSDLELVVAASKQFESLLEKQCGAAGRGLHEKISSVQHKLAEDVVDDLRFVATLRNKIVHETETTGLDNRARFEAVVSRLLLRLATYLPEHDSLTSGASEETASHRQSPALRLELPQDLREVRELTVEQAEILATFNPLHLDGVTTLSLESAKALVSLNRKGILTLDGLTMLSSEVAQALAKHRGMLSLSGLTTLSPEAASALATHDGPLVLNGMTSLPTSVAVAFASCRGPLRLLSVSHLSEEAAEALAKWGSKYVLDLRSLVTLSDRATAQLRLNPKIHFPGECRR